MRSRKAVVWKRLVNICVASVIYSFVTTCEGNMTNSHKLFGGISWARSFQDSKHQGEQLMFAALLTRPRGTVKQKVK